MAARIKSRGTKGSPRSFRFSAAARYVLAKLWQEHGIGYNESLERALFLYAGTKKIKIPKDPDAALAKLAEAA